MEIPFSLEEVVVENIRSGVLVCWVFGPIYQCVHMVSGWLVRKRRRFFFSNTIQLDSQVSKCENRSNITCENRSVKVKFFWGGLHPRQLQEGGDQRLGPLCLLGRPRHLDKGRVHLLLRKLHRHRVRHLL